MMWAQGTLGRLSFSLRPLKGDRGREAKAAKRWRPWLRWPLRLSLVEGKMRAAPSVMNRQHQRWTLWRAMAGVSLTV